MNKSSNTPKRKLNPNKNCQLQNKPSKNVLSDYSLKINFNTGPWLVEEKRKFYEGIISFPYSWEEIQKHIQTRDVKQIRSFSQKLFNKFQFHNISKQKMKIIHVNQITEKEFEEEFIHKAIEVGIRGEYITLYRKNKELILSRLKKLNKGKLSIIREGTKDYNEIYLKRKFLFKVDSKKEESNKLNFESSSTLFDSKSISCGDLLNYTNTCQEGSGTIETECYEMLELDLKGISAIHDNSISNYQTVLESQSSEKICDFMEKLNEDKFEMNNPIQTNFFDEFDQLILDSIRSKYYGVENDYEEVNMDYSDFQI